MDFPPAVVVLVPPCACVCAMLSPWGCQQVVSTSVVSLGLCETELVVLSVPFCFYIIGLECVRSSVWFH